MQTHHPVIPAQAGIQQDKASAKRTRTYCPAARVFSINWIPARAGMTAYVS
jgi:hypothetical protein